RYPEPDRASPVPGPTVDRVDGWDLRELAFPFGLLERVEDIGHRALRPRARQPRNARVARREAQMRERLFPHDAVRLEGSTPLKGDHAGAQSIVEDIPILGRDRIPIQVAQTFPDPFHVLAPRARLDGELAERGPLPEDHEWPV